MRNPFLAHSLCDADALSVVPVEAVVAADHEAVVVRLLADAPQTLGIVLTAHDKHRLGIRDGLLILCKTLPSPNVNISAREHKSDIF